MAYPVTVTWREDSDGVAVDSQTQLANILDRITTETDPRHPPLVLIANEGGVLTIGLGAAISTLNHEPQSGNPPYMISLGDPSSDGVIDFYYLGHHSQFALRNCIPNELARNAVLEYAQSGTLPKIVNWEKV